MGAAHGSALRLVGTEIELQRETKDFARWTLEDVVHLHGRFQKTFGLSITLSQFESLILLKAPETVAIKEVFDALDANSDGRIDGLEFLAALACVCRATFEEKARFAFDIFDFNHNGSLSVTELALLMKSVWVGMALLTGHSITPASGLSSQHQTHHQALRHNGLKQSEDALKVMQSCLRLAESAFSRYDKDGSDALNYEEFIEWARSNREFMLQVEQFRLISEKAIGFEEELSLPDGSDVDSDLEDESQWQSGKVVSTPTTSTSGSGSNEPRRAEISAPWIIEPSHAHLASKASLSSTSGGGGGLHSPTSHDMPPSVNLELEWIYGANGSTGRNTCKYLSNGDIVYIVSKYAIVYSTEFHRQRFYQGHRNVLMCLDVNASGEIVATGDGMGVFAPEIHIWNGLTLQCLAVLQNFHVDGISQLSFPAPASAASSTMNSTNIPTGANTNLNSNLIKKKAHTEWLVASIGSDANSSMALWDWQRNKLVASGRAHPKSGKRVLSMILNEDGNEVLVCGVRFVMFHQLDGRFFKHKKPQQMEKKLKTLPVCVTAAYYGSHHAVVGTSQGQLFQFHQHKLTKIVQAHSTGQSVNSCLLSCRSMVIFTAGKDGQVKQWDSTLSPIGNPIDLHAVLMQSTSGKETEILEGDDLRISALAYDAARHKFLVGTRMGHILELSDDDSPHAQGSTCVRIIASSHSGQAISCIAMAKTGVNFVSCGATDRCLKLWSLRRRMKIQKLALKFAPSTAEFSSSGELLAVGGRDGTIALIQSNAPFLKVLTTMKNTNSVVTSVRFSPKDDILAVACANGLIYLYTLDSDSSSRDCHFKRYALLKPYEHEINDAIHKAAASSLDFSIDGSLLKSQHGSASLRFWDLRQRACERVTAMNVVRNAIWQTYTSTIGWHVSGLKAQGARKAGDRASVANCAQASASQSMLLTLDVNGKLALTHFPCAASQDPNQQRVWLEKAIDDAHLIVTSDDGESLVGCPCAGFALNDSIVLSSSCRDGVICQWRVEKEISDVQPRAPCVYDDVMMAILKSFGLEDVYFGWDADDEYVPRQQPASRSTGAPQMTVSETSLKNAQRRTEAPDLDLTLHAVYGMNLERMTLNQGLACAGGGGGFVYAAGTLVVVDHVDHRKGQRVFQSGLTRSISCLVKHTTDPFLALGSHEDRKVVVWNVDTQRRVAELPCANAGCGDEASVLVGVAFEDANNSEGDLAAAIWKSRQLHIHSIVFYSWRKQKVITQAGMTSLPVLFGFFCSSLGGSESTASVQNFVSGGVDHVTFWRVDTACGHLQSQQGVFGRHALVQTLVCGVFVRPFVLTGTASGSVIIWEDGVAAYTLTPSAPGASHANSDSTNTIMTLLHVPSTQQVIGAVQNGSIIVWRYTKQTQSLSSITNVARCRASSFLEQVQTLNIFDLEWKSLSLSTSILQSSAANSDAGSRRSKMTALVRSLYLLEETNGVLAVLTDGHVVHVDSKLLADELSNSRVMTSSSNKSKGSIRVVLDHSQQQRGVALHPRDFLFATCCAGGTVCVWNLHTNALMKHRRLQTGAYAVAWSNSGDRLAVSLADGNVVILEGRALETVAEFSCGRPPSNANANALVLPKWCSLIKYSPTGSSDENGFLALACRDFNIYVYSHSSAGDKGGDKCELMHEFVGHTSRIEALDFSSNGLWLQSSSSSLDAQVLRWSLRAPNSSGDQLNGRVNSACTLADDEWHSWTNTFAGPVGGLSELFGSKVTALDRIRRDDNALTGSSKSQNDASKWSSLLPTMAVGTEDGNLLLCWYPLPIGDALMSLSKEYVGFFPADSIVKSIEMSFANGFVVACARNYCEEAIILVWKTDFDEELRQLERNPVHSHPAPALGSASHIQEHAKHEEPATVDTSLFEVDPFSKETAGDEFLAVKPWLGAIREPSAVPPNATTGNLPDQELALEFIYGVNAGATASNNAFYADDSWEIVYAGASVGIVYNTKTQSQLFNQGHQSNLISAMAIHPKGDLVATGECGVRMNPKVVLWDANSGSTIAEVETYHERGIRLLGFSPGGDCFVSIGMEDDHVMNVFSLGSSDDGMTKVKLLTNVKTSKQPVWNLCLNDEHEIVTCGNKHILFWQPIGAASGTSSVSGLFTGSMGMKKALFTSHKLCKIDSKVLAVAHFIKQQVVSSQSDGSLYVWKDRRCVDVKEHAHTGSIPTLFVDKKKQLVFSGGSDGKICSWNAQLECIKALDIAHLAASAGLRPSLTSTKIQSLQVRDGRVLISTAGGEICEIIEPSATATNSGASSSGSRLLVHVRGHSKGELWGLDVHPSKIQFATAGDDGYIRLWEAPTRSLLAHHAWKSGGLPRAVAFSCDGNHVAAGSTDGKVRVLNSTLDTVVLEWKCSLVRGVQVLKYSPDGNWLAVGCHDQRVHVFDAHTYKKHGECRGHSGTVTHMDFSKDSHVLQSTAAGAGELLFWNVFTLKQIPSASAVRDVVWATWSCPFGWPVQGIWAPGSDINAVCRSDDKSVVATGDDFGLVKLFQYPSAGTSPAQARTYLAHASHVTSCAFTKNDMFLLTTGGRDQSICQFKYRATKSWTS
ncbi:hypothetical protein Gpo141_00007149 [Globisporangium polare]